MGTGTEPEPGAGNGMGGASKESIDIHINRQAESSLLRPQKTRRGGGGVKFIAMVSLMTQQTKISHSNAAVLGLSVRKLLQ